MSFNPTIKFKLRIGLVNQVILIVIIMISLVFLNNRINKISEKSHELINESEITQQLAFKIDGYFNHTIDNTAVQAQYDLVVSSLSNNTLKNRLKNIWENINTIEELEDENDKLEEQVVQLTQNSVDASNNYILTISQKLADEKSRFNVSTFERSIIARANLNINHNHNVKYMFGSIKQDIELKGKFLNYLDEAILNSEKDIKRLKYTSFASLPVQSKQVNEEIKRLSKRYIKNQEEINHIREETSKTADEILSGINETNINNINNANNQTVKIIMLALLILIILSVVLILINRNTAISIDKFIHRFTNYVSEIGGGNLGINIEQDLLKRKDEFGFISRTLKETVVKLSSTMTQINEDSLTISEIGKQLSSSSLQISQGASEQASSIEEVSSSMEEMMANIEQNTENAEKTESISKSSASGVEKVGSSAQQSLASVRNIASKITIVNDIAFQTNLLALNAAVEAARAGEQGKGFAVVASEVRKLAERSKIAADEIDKLSKSSLSATEDSGELMQSIVPEILKTSQLIQEIATASNEQRSGAEQINSALQQLNIITQQNAASSEQLASSAQELANRGDRLKKNVSFFKSTGNISRSKLETKTSDQRVFDKNTLKDKKTAETNTMIKKDSLINVTDNTKDSDFESF